MDPHTLDNLRSIVVSRWFICQFNIVWHWSFNRFVIQIARYFEHFVSHVWRKVRVDL